MYKCVNMSDMLYVDMLICEYVDKLTRCQLPLNLLAHFSLQCAQAMFGALPELGWAHFSGKRLGPLQGAVCPREVG